MGFPSYLKYPAAIAALCSSFMSNKIRVEFFPNRGFQYLWNETNVPRTGYHPTLRAVQFTNMFCGITGTAKCCRSRQGAYLLKENKNISYRYREYKP
jgi:hypothetical protein